MHNKVVKKFVKWSLISFGIFILLSILAFFSVYIYFSKTSNFDKTKLDVSSFNITLYDDKENLIKEDNLINHKSIKLSSLPPHVYECFVATEDKNFYKHKGLDYKRMVKATLVNLKSFRFKQGASTISQQLIKNTHLTNEKTLTRKFREIAITKQMEKQLSKDEILESYLNCIYFGNNCYGIESAANFYFSKSAKNLTPSESAILAGVISAPSKFNPITRAENCKKKRDIVLENLCNYGTISPSSLQEEKEKPITLNITKSDESKINSYSQMAIDESQRILGLSAKKIGLLGYQIHTYQNPKEQLNLNEVIQSSKSLANGCEISSINMDTKTGAISSYYGTGNLKLSQIKRQPGSAIKPVLVYAPALEENKIFPCSIVEDAPININGYSPNNASKTYMGNVSVRTALNKSLNTVAVKVLSYVGIDDAKYYAKKCGIEFDESDNNYALALGGFKHGTTLEELTNSYLPLANQGKFVKSTFIKYITDEKGKIVYHHNPVENFVFRDDTSFLMTDMLRGCVNFGTSKKLSTLGFEIAGKTGTVGTKAGNTDGYSISYTSDKLTGVWVGRLDNKPQKDLSGSKLPTTIAKQIYENVLTQKPKDFSRPNSVEEIEIDLLALKENSLIQKANTFTPERYKVKEIFSKFNLPNQVSENFVKLDAPKLETITIDGKKIITFDAKDYVEYELFNEKDGKTDLVLTCSNTSGTQEYVVKSTKDKYQSFYLVAKIKNFADNVEVISNKSNVIKFCFSQDENTQKVDDDRWYI